MRFVNERQPHRPIFCCALRSKARIVLLHDPVKQCLFEPVALILRRLDELTERARIDMQPMIVATENWREALLNISRGAAIVFIEFDRPARGEHRFTLPQWGYKHTHERPPRKKKRRT